MRSRRLARALAIGMGSALVLGVTALPVGSQTEPEPVPEVAAVSGSASGLFASILVADNGSDEILSVGPTPQVTLPPEGGGPFTDSLASLDLEGDPLVGDLLAVSTEGALGPDGFAASSATVADLNPEELAELPTASVVEVECRSDLVSGPTGSTTILGGVISGFDGEVPIPEAPEPNTVVADEEVEIPVGGGTVRAELLVMANVQTVTETDISVIGLHMVLLEEFVPAEGPVEVGLDLEIVVGEVSCGIDPTVPVIVEPPEPMRIEPRFTG